VRAVVVGRPLKEGKYPIISSHSRRKPNEEQAKFKKANNND
jgi:hypothetical protein